jgi:hypothetical protein
MHHRHWLIVGAAVGIAALAGIYIVHTYAAATPNYVPTITPYSVNQMLPTKTIAVGTTTLTVEVATTPAEQAGGLSGRTGLAPGTGMLFVSDSRGVSVLDEGHAVCNRHAVVGQRGHCHVHCGQRNTRVVYPNPAANIWHANAVAICVGSSGRLGRRAWCCRGLQICVIVFLACWVTAPM